MGFLRGAGPLHPTPQINSLSFRSISCKLLLVTQSSIFLNVLERLSKIITRPQLPMLKCAKAPLEFNDFPFFPPLLCFPDIHHKATTGTNSFSPLQSPFKGKSSQGFLPGVNMRNKRPDNNEDFMETHRYEHPSVRSAIK